MESLVVRDAAENDLNVFNESWSEVENRTFYCDKIYHNKDWFEQFSKNHNSQMCTPVKSVKAMTDRVRQWNKAADALY